LIYKLKIKEKVNTNFANIVKNSKFKQIKHIFKDTILKQKIRIISREIKGKNKKYINII